MLVLSVRECIYAIYQRYQPTVHSPPIYLLSKMLLSITDSAWMLNKEILLPITGFVTLQIFILPFWLNDCDAITVPYVLKTIKILEYKEILCSLHCRGGYMQGRGIVGDVWRRDEGKLPVWRSFLSRTLAVTSSTWEKKQTWQRWRRQDFSWVSRQLYWLRG